MSEGMPITTSKLDYYAECERKVDAIFLPDKGDLFNKDLMGTDPRTTPFEDLMTNQKRAIAQLNAEALKFVLKTMKWDADFEKMYENFMKLKGEIKEAIEKRIKGIKDEIPSPKVYEP